MIDITFYGHACFGVQSGGTRLLIDPWLTGNPLCPITADEAQADCILVTHGHHDHAGDAADIARRTGAEILTTVEVGAALFSDPSLRVTAGNIGGTLPLPGGGAKLVTAIHGSGVPGGLACGFLIELGGRRVLHMGDTALTRDFELLADSDRPIDVMLVPVGGFYTMDPADALKAVSMVRPRLAVPMHYNTFPAIVQDPEIFRADAESRGFAVRVLAPGQTLSV